MAGKQLTTDLGLARAVKSSLSLRNRLLSSAPKRVLRKPNHDEHDNNGKKPMKMKQEAGSASRCIYSNFHHTRPQDKTLQLPVVVVQPTNLVRQTDQTMIWLWQLHGCKQVSVLFFGTKLELLSLHRRTMLSSISGRYSLNDCSNSSGSEFTIKKRTRFVISADIFAS